MQKKKTEKQERTSLSLCIHMIHTLITFCGALYSLLLIRYLVGQRRVEWSSGAACVPRIRVPSNFKIRVFFPRFLLLEVYVWKLGGGSTLSNYTVHQHQCSIFQASCVDIRGRGDFKSGLLFASVAHRYLLIRIESGYRRHVGQLCCLVGGAVGFFCSTTVLYCTSAVCMYVLCSMGLTIDLSEQCSHWVAFGVMCI